MSAEAGATSDSTVGIPEFRVSAGHLADFVHRGGDIGPRATPSVGALEGLRRQQRHQAAPGSPADGAEGAEGADGEDARYRTEVRLEGQWCSASLGLRIGGRADGVHECADSVRIEEIKTHRGDVAAVRAAQGAAHEAQLRIYGALWFQVHPEETRAVELVLVYLDADAEGNMDEEGAGPGVTRVPIRMSREALARDLDATCAAYADWLVSEQARLELRDGRLASLAFPAAAFRAGQQTLARAVWTMLSREGTLLAQAPTGIGKTLGVLYAALRRLPGIGAERLLYLTPRGSARALALAAVERMDPDGTCLRVVELVGRERICPWPETPCRADACERAHGHYDRRRAALRALLGHDEDVSGAGGILTRARVERVSEAHCVCPAALQRDAARFADVVVGDYNYAFDPFARQQALLDPDDGGAVALIDEAHNLPERARAMFSPKLEATALTAAAAEARGLGAPFARHLRTISSRLRTLGESASGAGGASPRIEPDALVPLLDALEAGLVDLGGWLAKAPPGPPVTRFETLRGELSRFLEIGRLAHGRRAAAFLVDLSGEAGAVRLVCLDAAPFVEETLDVLSGLVLFSATLAPMALRRRELGIGAKAREIVLANPFPPERRLVLSLRDLDLRARHRARHLPALAASIAELVGARRGNYLVFAPSFEFLGQIADALSELLPEVELLRQARGMNEDERSAFAERFRARREGGARDRSLVGLAVSGGLFAEGIDLPGDALIGVVIAGLPLPAPDVERRALADYHGAAGEEVAFRAPAVTRMLQAAGRLVRSAQDAGIVCIADARMHEHRFRCLLPDDYVPVSVAANEVGAVASAFWTHLGDEA